MKFKKYLTVAISTLTLAASFAGCGTVKTQSTKEKGLFSGYDNYQYYDTEKSLSGSIMNPGSTPVKSYDGNLGRGYNIIDSNFFSTDDVHLTNPVLDTNKLASDGLIYSRPTKKKDTVYISGLTATSYENKFNAKVGIKYDGAFFKSSFDTSFNSSRDLTTQDSFEKTIREIGKERDYIDLSYLSMDDLKKYVTTTAKVDINGDLSPDKLIKKYGTHVMCDIELGGRMEINYVYHNKNKISEEEIDAKAKEVYNGISAKEGTAFSEEAKEFAESSEFNAYQWGGTTDDDISSLEAAQHDVCSF
jgi:hypothetical protein